MVKKLINKRSKVRDTTFSIIIVILALALLILAYFYNRFINNDKEENIVCSRRL